MRFVVTGGCGYIGSAVVRALVERGDHVLNIDSRRKSIAVPALAPIAGKSTHVRLESTIKDATMLRALFHEFKPDRVFHFASSAAEETSVLFETEIATTLAILGACKEYVSRLDESARRDFRLVQALRLPRPPGQTSPGQSPVRDHAQRAAEALAINWCRAHDLPYVACMGDEVFGPWQPETTLLPAALASIRSQRPCELPGNGMTVRDFLPLSDFVQGLVLAAERGARFACYELSAGTERRDLDLVEAGCAILDKRRPRAGGSWSAFLQKGGAAPSDGFSPMLDPSQAERDLGWSPGSFYEGLSRAVAWAISRDEPVQAPPQVLPSAAE